jgi:hypothetical protein
MPDKRVKRLPYTPRLDGRGNPVVVSEAAYFAVPAWFHPHPQGDPCHDGCRTTGAGGV